MENIAGSRVSQELWKFSEVVAFKKVLQLLYQIATMASYCINVVHLIANTALIHAKLGVKR